MRAKTLLWGAVVLFAAMGAAVAREKTVELKFSHWVPPKHPLRPSWVEWANSIEKDSGGSIKITIYPAEQLGKAFDHYDMARGGIADISFVNPGYQPGRFPLVAAGELPFLIANAKGGSAGFDAWYRGYADKEMKDTHFCYGFVHDPGTFHARKKIAVPDDVRGLKIRPANATVGQFMTLLGATNVQASAPEARDALERGVADAITFPWGSIILFGIDKVVKFHMDAALYVSDFTVVLNKAKYDGLSAAQKKVIDSHCSTAWAETIAAAWADFEAGGRDKLRKEAGHTVYPITRQQLALWRAAAAPLEKQWADKVKAAGYDPAAALAALKTSLAKHQAAY